MNAMPPLDLSRASIPEEVLHLVPAARARRLQALPLGLDEPSGRLRVALPDPVDPSLIDQLEAATGRTIAAVPVADHEQLRRVIRRLYPEPIQGGTSGAASLLHRIVARAIQQRASDIHLDPRAEAADVFLRVDGCLRHSQALETAQLAELVTVIKVESSLDIAEKRAPQDGQLRLLLSGEEVNLRIAIIPTIHGEHVTLRLLSGGTADDLATLDDLGFTREQRALFTRELNAPNGIILLSGPTGSGKTTTLYAALRHIRASGDRHIVSIEDPVERPVEGVTQVRIDSGSGRVTFHSALRSILRHDPDVILIGEIRDSETADIAIKAALTGHLVLSTIHTNDAVGTITRLTNLGVLPYLVAATLRLSIAQRLVRRPTPGTLQWIDADPATRALLGWTSDAPGTVRRVPVPIGGQLDGGTGYSGRIALYEMLDLDAEVRMAIAEGAQEAELAKHFFEKRGLPRLRDDGAAKTLQGLTTPAEVGRVVFG